jgi:NAD(P)-binding Rossmann-like domain
MGEADILEADYLVVGSGAMGMAFTDALVSESNATIVVVDRHDQPGGHWNDAYSFVRLHSASAFYGVNSTALGEDTLDAAGLNRGFHERASAAEICAYFDRVMRRVFLPTGRVRYFPRSEYLGEGRFISLLSKRERRVNAKKIVDATFTDTSVPSRHTLPFPISQDTRFIAPNDLPNAKDSERYVIVGAGKTGIDACLWLLEHEVPADRIVWIMPRDSWLLDRTYYEPRQAFWWQRMSALVQQTELIHAASSIQHLFELLDAHGQLLRIDPNVVPTRYRCATVSQAELAQLRRIRHIVRLGHVRSIERDRIVLEHGDIPTNAEALHVDCTASGIRSRPAMPVFAGESITLQPVRTCQQCFSAALIAHVELTHETDDRKNALCRPISLPIRAKDWLTMFSANLRNQGLWMSTPDMREWIARSRLDLNYGRTTPLSTQETELLQRFKAGAGLAAEKIASLLRSEEPLAEQMYASRLRA